LKKKCDSNAPTNHEKALFAEASAQLTVMREYKIAYFESQFKGECYKECEK